MRIFRSFCCSLFLLYEQNTGTYPRTVIGKRSKAKSVLGSCLQNLTNSRGKRKPSRHSNRTVQLFSTSFKLKPLEYMDSKKGLAALRQPLFASLFFRHLLGRFQHGYNRIAQITIAAFLADNDGNFYIGTMLPSNRPYNFSKTIVVNSQYPFCRAFIKNAAIFLFGYNGRF